MCMNRNVTVVGLAALKVITNYLNKRQPKFVCLLFTQNFCKTFFVGEKFDQRHRKVERNYGPVQ